MSHRNEKGLALVTVMLLAGLATALLAAYFFLTRVEFLTTKSALDGNRGFYAAEAGLNIRAELIRDEFQGYNVPSGTPPTTPVGSIPCQAGTPGTDDFACATHGLRDRDVLTYVEEDPGNPQWIVIPPGETYQNLNAQVYAYDLSSTSIDVHDDLEAMLLMRALVRLVPMFQFAVFYDKDLEILPSPPMTLEGPVHTNGDLYLGATSSLTIEGQVTVAGDMFHGRKDSDTCMAGSVSVFDPASALAIPSCGPGRIEILEADTAPFNGMIQLGVEPLTVPPPETLDATPGQIYWDKADLRVMLDLNGVPSIEVRNADGTVDAASSAFLNLGCGIGASPVESTSTAFYNFREGSDIRMLEIDMTDLLNCVEVNSAVMGGKLLDDTTEGGLVFYFGVDGPDSSVPNNYGVRVQNGAHLAPTVGPTSIQGLTVVSDQAMYVRGDYNSDMDWKPAAFLADSLNILSNNWNDANSHNADVDSRLASSTAVYAAFLAGTDSTGGQEGAGGQDSAIYNGGVENYPRFHEKWSGRTLTYRGSFVSLDLPRHVDGPWGNQSYVPPIRDWGYELRFNNAANLPPLSPRFVSLKQDQFLRKFDL